MISFSIDKKIYLLEKRICESKLTAQEQSSLLLHKSFAVRSWLAINPFISKETRLALTRDVAPVVRFEASLHGEFNDKEIASLFEIGDVPVMHGLARNLSISDYFHEKLAGHVAERVSNAAKNSLKIKHSESIKSKAYISAIREISENLRVLDEKIASAIQTEEFINQPRKMMN